MKFERCFVADSARLPGVDSFKVRPNKWYQNRLFSISVLAEEAKDGTNRFVPCLHVP